MVRNVIDLLMVNDHYGQSELIEIAKGKNEIPKTWKSGFKQIKREVKWLTKK